jgi:hypothetical protein
MGLRNIWRLGALLALAWATPAGASFLSDLGVKDIAGIRPTRVLVLGRDNRRADKEFATSHKLKLEQLRRAHAASGIVACGDSHGAGQLTLASDIITTASHVFFDEQGAGRAMSCDFIVELEGKERRIPIDMASIVVGARRPYSTKAVHDWAVAKLTFALDEITPYDLANNVAVNESVEFVARGHSDWGGGTLTSFEDCQLRSQTDQIRSGPREFAFDCNTGDGASGGAVLLGDDHTRLGAILVGWRSDDPSRISSFSSTNYNFVVSVEGAFRRAITDAAQLRIAHEPPTDARRLANASTVEDKQNRHRSQSPSRPATP